MIPLGPAEWALLGASALFIGAAKTSVQNLVFFGIAAFALVLPARESTAAVVVLLVSADVIAVLRYRKLCDWGLLRRLLPFVIPGEVLGAVFLAWVSDAVLRVLIGALLLVLLAPQLVELVRGRAAHTGEGDQPAPAASEPHPVVAGLVGTAAGFTTMAANVGGPIFTWYLLLLRVDKARFLGTGAIFFAVVNVLKLPAGVALGLFTPQTLAILPPLLPVLVVGAALGAWLVHRLTQRAFDLIAVGMSAVAAAALLLPVG